MDYFDLLRALVSLCVTLGLLLLLAYAWKRWGTGLTSKFQLPTQNTRITILETKRLTAQNSLHLIRVDDTEHLITTTPTQTTLLQTLTKKK